LIAPYRARRQLSDKAPPAADLGIRGANAARGGARGKAGARPVSFSTAGGKRAEFLALLHRLLDAHGAKIEPATIVNGATMVKISRSRRLAPKPRRRSP
jgi:hypothetical protein